MKKKDGILFLIMMMVVLLGLAGVQALRSSQANHGPIAVIIQDDQIIATIELDNVSAPREIKLTGTYDEIIEVEKGRIRFKEANCPDKICVKTGWLEDPGDIAVCLPNRAIVRIEAKE